MNALRPGEQLAHELAAKPRRRISSGFRQLDNLTNGGLRTGDTSVIAAYTGHGKSAFVEQAALDVSVGDDVLLLPLEMGKRDTFVRLGAKIAKCSVVTFERGGLDRMTQAELDMRKLHVRAPEGKRPITVDDIAKVIRQVRAPLVIIDHVRNIRGWVSDINGRGGHVGPTTVTQRFAELADELDVHIMLCQQLSMRSQYGARRPLTAQIMDTSALEQLAALVVLVYRPFYHRGSRDTITELLVHKNRYGATCTLHQRWVGETMSLWELSVAESEQLDCTCRHKKSGAEVEG